MFDVGFAELLIIFVIALIVLGPERLPEAARALGRWAGRARAFARNLTNELDREVRYSETAQRLREAQDSVQRQVDEFKTGTTGAVQPQPENHEEPARDALAEDGHADTPSITADQESDHGTPAPQARPAPAPDKRDG